MPSLWILSYGRILLSENCSFLPTSRNGTQETFVVWAVTAHEIRSGYLTQDGQSVFLFRDLELKSGDVSQFEWHKMCQKVEVRCRVLSKGERLLLLEKLAFWQAVLCSPVQVNARMEL